jgi:hypothetical protein
MAALIKSFIAVYGAFVMKLQGERNMSGDGD